MTAVILGLVLLLPFAVQLVHPEGTVLGQRRCDNPSFFYFFNHYTGQGWRDWQAPFWNPHIMFGVPFLAEGQGAFFHPFSVLYALLPTGVAINWQWALGTMLTGLGFWGFLRALELSRPAAFCGALSWSFSSAIVGIIYAGHLNRMLGLVSLPFILMFWERYRRDGRIGNLAGLAAAYALLIFSGFPQFTFIFSLFMLCYVGGSAVTQCRTVPALRRELSAISTLGLALLLGTGLAAVQLLPSIDFAVNSFRSQSTYNFCTSFSFAPENIVTLLCPRFFGTLNVPGVDHYWGRNFFWEMWIYIGIVPLIAAAGGILSAPRRRATVLLFCAAAFFIVGLGKHTPIFRILFDHVPGFDIFRAPAKFTLVSLYCLVTLAAFGLDAWCRRFHSPAPPPKPARSRERKPKAVSGHSPANWSYRASLATALGLFVLSVGLYLYYIPGHGSADSNWAGLVKWRHSQGENYSRRPAPDDAAFLATTGSRAGAELIRAMVLTLLAAGALLLAKSRPWRGSPAYAILILFAADFVSFVRPFAARFDESITRYPDGLLDVVADEPYQPVVKVSCVPPLFD